MAIRTNTFAPTKPETPPEPVATQQETAAPAPPASPQQEAATEQPSVETQPQEKANTVFNAPAQVPPKPPNPPVPALMDLWNSLDPLVYGRVFPRIVPGSGIIQTDSKIMLGKYIDIQVFSMSDRWQVAPDIDPKLDPEAKFSVRSSYDNKNIIDQDGNSMTIDEYIEFNKNTRIAAKLKPYDEWRVAKYLDVFAVIFNAEPEYLAVAQNLQMVQISISTTATKAFTGFFMQGKLSVARGLIPADKQNCMRVVIKPMINNKGQNYSIFIPDLVPPSVLEMYSPVAV